MAEFSNTLNGLNNGTTETELSLRLKELVTAVSATGKKGSIALKLTVERNKKNERLIEMTADVAAKIPTPPPPTAAFMLYGSELVALADTQYKLPLTLEGSVVEIEARALPEPTYKEVGE